MHPRHLNEVSRKAVAPYNFVELPNKIVEAEELPDKNGYYPNRHTGKIQCTLKTSTPLYIRCGLTPEDFAEFGDKNHEEMTAQQRQKYAEFFQHPINSNPVLPASSLRGMLRNILEIISFSKIERVSNHQKFFFRAVAAENDNPLSKLYKDKLKDVRVGYLEFNQKQDKWFIQPALQINGKYFIKVKEQDIFDIKDNLPSLIKMKKSNYIPQYIKISFQQNSSSFDISEDLTQDFPQGWLVTSGNMLENQLDKSERERERLLNRKEGRKNHYIIAQADTDSNKKLEISQDAIRDYRNSLTKFQQGKEKPFKDNPKNQFSENMGALQPGLPIFYCQPKSDDIVTLFGQSPNFRIPYIPKSNQTAACAVDFIPKEIHNSHTIDLTDAIFGFVREKQNRAGRVSISDGFYLKDDSGIYLTDDTITPKILASPKPTTFQHYLVQTKEQKPQLKHYGSQPNQDTVIRGNKLYWHKRNIKVDHIQADKKEVADKPSQYTQIKPIKTGVSFEFTINFENLTDVELGALLWILNLTNNKLNLNLNLSKGKNKNKNNQETYRLSLGMGKPLGMGAIAIENFSLILNQTQQRYTKLFDNDNWLTGDRSIKLDEYQSFVTAFDNYIVTRIDDTDLPCDFTDEEDLSLKDIPRIQMLLAMLSWNCPPSNETRYMEIERDINKGETENEYKERLVLPNPLQIKKLEDKRRINRS